MQINDKNSKDGILWERKRTKSGYKLRISEVKKEFVVPYEKGKLKNIKKDSEYKKIRSKFNHNTVTKAEVVRIPVYNYKTKKTNLKNIGVKVSLLYIRGNQKYKKGMTQYNVLKKNKRFKVIEQERIKRQKTKLKRTTHLKKQSKIKETQLKLKKSILDGFTGIFTTFRLGVVSFNRFGKSNQYITSVNDRTEGYISFNEYYRKFLGQFYIDSTLDEIKQGRTISGGWTYRVRGYNTKSKRFETIIEDNNNHNV